jgi:hypothetical protein
VVQTKPDSDERALSFSGMSTAKEMQRKVRCPMAMLHPDDRRNAGCLNVSVRCTA